MKALKLILVLVVVVASSCTKVHYLDSMGEREAKSFERHSTTREFSLYLSDGTVNKGKDLAVELDSVFWTDVVSDAEMSAAAVDVREIVFRSRSDGFFEGFAVGFGVGASIGVVMGLIAGPSSGAVSFTRTETAALMGFLLGIPAGVLGSLMGTARGSTDVYFVADSLATGTRWEDAESPGLYN